MRLTSTAVAKAFNVFPRKGALAAGSDADVIILDPEVKHTISASTHHSRIDTNIYEGRQVTGKVQALRCTCSICASPALEKRHSPPPSM